MIKVSFIVQPLTCYGNYTKLSEVSPIILTCDSGYVDADSPSPHDPFVLKFLLFHFTCGNLWSTSLSLIFQFTRPLKPKKRVKSSGRMMPCLRKYVITRRSFCRVAEGGGVVIGCGLNLLAVEIRSNPNGGELELSRAPISSSL